MFKFSEKEKLTSAALVTLAVFPVGAAFAVGQDSLGVHAGAGLVHVVVVADAGVPLVVGHPDAGAILGPGESAGGRHGQGEGGGDDDAGKLHGEVWGGGVLK